MNDKRTHSSSARQAKQRQKRIVRLVVLLASVAVISGVAFAAVSLLNGNNEPAAPSSVAVAAPPTSSSAAPSSSSSTPEPKLPEPPALTGAYDFTETDWPPLYNRFYPIPESVSANIEDTLISINGSVHYMAPGAAEAYMAMQQAAAAEGLNLNPVSGYRSHATQTNNYLNALNNKLGSMGEAEARAQTQMYYAIPGTSEHEAGLAMDIGVVDDSFAYSREFTWLQEHAAEFGFIFRYQNTDNGDGVNTLDITNIAWEPWHYRWVGANHAAEMQRLGLVTLEEYIAYSQGITWQELEKLGEEQKDPIELQNG